MFTPLETRERIRQDLHQRYQPHDDYWVGVHEDAWFTELAAEGYDIREVRQQLQHLINNGDVTYGYKDDQFIPTAKLPPQAGISPFLEQYQA